MNYKAFVLALILSTCSLLANAQLVTTYHIKYDVEGRYATTLVKPSYYPEAGTVVVDIIVNKQGKVIDAKLRESETTVKNGRQQYRTESAAELSEFNRSEDAPDSLRGTITYLFTEMSQRQLDSTKIEALVSIEERIKKVERAVSVNQYELHPTDNMWTFLEVDTIFGWVYKVQFSTNGEKYRFKEIISSADLRKDSYLNSDVIIPGRFTLYKTENMYNFILLDKIDGRTWQVQWSSSNSFVIPIK